MEKAIFFIWILVLSFSSVHIETKVVAFHKKEIKLDVTDCDRMSNWAENYVKEVPPPNASSETRVMPRRGSTLRRPARYGGTSSATAARKAKEKQKKLSNRCALTCIYDNISEPISVLDRMQAHIYEWEPRNDPRAIFLRCYRMMTANMLQAIEQSRFYDQVWVEALLHRFADYYFNALVCYDYGDQETPQVWHYVHEVSQQKELHVLQNLLLGINAHINYDLVLTVVDMLEPEWSALSEAQQRNRYADHCLVNTIIAETIDKVQDEVIESHDPMMGVVDRAFDRLDEKLLSFLITRWREEVWKQAMNFLQCESAEERKNYHQALEQEVMKRAKRLALDF